MSTGDDATQRVGNEERQAAIEALGEHWRAGRLDPAEHERRTTAAFSAVTRGDLDALFADLPGAARAASPAGSSGPVAQDSPSGAVTGQVVPTPAAAEPERGSGLFPADSWVAQHRDAVMGITPFVAVALFFVTRWWVWFLLIPALGVALYAGEDDPSGRRARRQARDERRRPGRGE